MMVGADRRPVVFCYQQTINHLKGDQCLSIDSDHCCSSEAHHWTRVLIDTCLWVDIDDLDPGGIPQIDVELLS